MTTHIKIIQKLCRKRALSLNFIKEEFNPSTFLSHSTLKRRASMNQKKRDEKSHKEILTGHRVDAVLAEFGHQQKSYIYCTPFCCEL